MIVVDASALVALALSEPEAESIGRCLGKSGDSVISPINYVETGIILISRGRFEDKPTLDLWLKSIGVRVAPRPDAHGALEAYLAFGRGFHRAKLNLADCFAYALAKASDAPLLYKGDDFAMTDAKSAVQPT